MANDTIIQQGRFTSDGSSREIILRERPGWMKVWNYTEAGAQNDNGTEFYWQFGMDDDTGLYLFKSGAGDTLNMQALGSNGFTLLETDESDLGAIDTTVTAVSNDSPPRVTVTSTASLRNFDIVRMRNVSGAQQLGGIDFSIAVLTGTRFSLRYMTQIVAGTNGSFQLIKYDPLFYPRRRYISAITRASQAVVTLTVKHTFTVGQEVRLNVPSAYGMREISGLTATVVAVDSTNNTITLDIDSSGFSAFAFPLTADVPFTPAQVIPVGESADGDYVNLLDDGTINNGFVGLRLAGGADAPAGSNNDVIYWAAGRSDKITNE